MTMSFSTDGIAIGITRRRNEQLEKTRSRGICHRRRTKRGGVPASGPEVAFEREIKYERGFWHFLKLET
jgi:hypothetical protein